MKNGYVTVCIYRKNGKQIRKLAHRLSYEFFIRKIPKGKVIDHTCRVRNCVNPNHLQVITFRKNILIGKGIPAINHAKKFCKNGHEFKKKNTFFIKLKSGFFGRKCKICNRIWQRNRRKINLDKFRAYDRERYWKHRRFQKRNS